MLLSPSTELIRVKFSGIHFLELVISIVDFVDNNDNKINEIFVVDSFVVFSS